MTLHPFSSTFSVVLQPYRGPLELLLHLVKKGEIDIERLPLKEITLQCLQKAEQEGEINTTADAMGLSALLLLLKSKQLLPSDPTEDLLLEESSSELLQHFLDYCHFRQAGAELIAREEGQKPFFTRIPPPFEKESSLGLEEVSLEKLQELVSELLKRSFCEPSGVVKEEAWHISDQIAWLKTMAITHPLLPFGCVFSDKYCKQAWIVSFLAILELMKRQEVKVVKENTNYYIHFS